MVLASPRRLLFVLGMHRSGTSAMCAALDSCHVSFGENLLDPMLGVNDEGFWEDLELVRINEQILSLIGVEWYTVRLSLIAEAQWAGEGWAALREEGRTFLKRGFGDGLLDVLKDPRLCITLPFWLALCAELGIETCVCVTSRAPLDIAKSLQKRDGFPLGFGLRLYATYRRLIAANSPADTIFVCYNDLIENPGSVISKFSQTVPLTVDAENLGRAVRVDLRHQASRESSSLLEIADSGELDLKALDAEIDAQYPLDESINQIAEELVSRGQKLSSKGKEFEESLEKVSSQHIAALATLDERDAQIAVQSARLEAAGKHLSDALAVIPERDSQIEELDQRLSELGEQHSYALGIVAERDQQLQEAGKQIMDLEARRDRLFRLPGIGRIIRKLWFYERS